MKIVADENIPLVDHYFGSSGEVLLKPGRSITREDLLDADILLVRSVTKVDKKLLHDTKVKFVGSATAGFDHLDINWLNQAGIRFSVAKGCNAVAVVEYVICVIAALQKMNFLLSKKSRAAVIGVGQIGRQVVHVLEKMGFEVVQCDPLRALDEPDFVSTPIEELVDLDFISLHVPLVASGSYPTYHLIEKNFLQRQKKNCVLLNSSRGEVISFEDLKTHGQHLLWCLDVWEGEPSIDLDILRQAVIATPHIAGYSVQSKYRGAKMIYQAAAQQQVISQLVTDVQFPRKEMKLDKDNWHESVLKIFDPLLMTQKMKSALLDNPNAFDLLRKNFSERYEFEFVGYCIEGDR